MKIYLISQTANDGYNTMTAPLWWQKMKMKRGR